MLREEHDARIARMRRAYGEAHARLVARLTGAPDEAAHRSPGGGAWSVAQIGWHVAAVDGSFAGLVSGELPGAKPLAEGVRERPWDEVVRGIPDKIDAGPRVQPPPEVTREAALAALATSAARLDAALAGLAEDRATGLAVTHPIVGLVTIGQIGDWAAAHTIRHNAQAKRTLAALQA